MTESYLTEDEKLLYQFIQQVGCINEMQIYELLKDRPNAIVNTKKSLGLLIRQQYLYLKENKCLTAGIKDEPDADVITALWVFLDNIKGFNRDIVGSTFAGTYPSSLIFSTENSLVEVVVIDKTNIRLLPIINEKYLQTKCDEESDDNFFKYILIFKDKETIKKIPKSLDFIKDNAYICCIVDAWDAEHYEYNENFEKGLEEMPAPSIEYIW